MEELERKTEEKIIRKKELRRKIKEKLSFTTEKYRKEADRKITESILKLEEYQSAGCVFCFLAPWTVHCVIPAMKAAEFGEAFAVAPASVPFVNYYSIAMLVILVIAIVTGYGRKNK